MTQTIPAALFNAAKQWSSKIAVIEGNKQRNFQQLLEDSIRCSKAMLASGINFGDRIALWAPNIYQWITVAVGAQMAGAIVVPLNTRYKGTEAQEIINASGSRLLFTINGFLDTDYPSLLANLDMPNLEATVLIRQADATNICTENDFQQFLKRAESISNEQWQQRYQQLDEQSLSDIMYTSGTTGKPKGVMSTHGQVIQTFVAWTDAINMSDKDVYLIVNPFFHSFGYKAGWVACLLKGATLIPQAVFNPDAVLSTIETLKITLLPGAPTIFQTLLKSKQLDKHDLSSLRCAVTGAATVPEQLVLDMRDKLGFSEVYTGYGLTECGVVSICCKGDDFKVIANTAGKAIEGTEVKVVDDEGHTVDVGEIGTINVRGFNVMQGYFNDETATKATIDEQGWLDTGDIGWVNEQGYIKITDRAKDMYICGGFNCYPADIENLLLQHPAIIDVAVIGVTNERMGEVGQAYVVCSGDETPTTQQLTDWAKEKMANFKVPRQFVVVDSLPRNASGKVQKFLLS